MSTPRADLKRTTLYHQHLELKARMMPFAGWEMPLQYQGIIAEAKAVRSRHGMFDVSHMGRIQVNGEGSRAFLDMAVTADVENLALGRARYSLMCLPQGGIIDDIMVYYLQEKRYLVVCNASNRSKVLDRFRSLAGSKYNVAFRDTTEETIMVACQGPEAVAVLAPIIYPSLPHLRPFSVAAYTFQGRDALVARTGYTGEDGMEVILPASQGPDLWRTLLGKEVTPCGLGARDVLRLEAGLRLYGSDMDATTNPLEAGLERFVRMDKAEFVGKSALLEAQAKGIVRTLVGVRMEERGIPRPGYPLLHNGENVGQITSGTYSPTLDRGIGLGYVPKEFSTPGINLLVDLRGKPARAQVVQLPFYTKKKGE